MFFSTLSVVLSIEHVSELSAGTGASTTVLLLVSFSISLFNAGSSEALPSISAMGLAVKGLAFIELATDVCDRIIRGGGRGAAFFLRPEMKKKISTFI